MPAAEKTAAADLGAAARTGAGENAGSSSADDVRAANDASGAASASDRDVRSGRVRRLLRAFLPGVAALLAVAAFVVFYVRPFEGRPDSSNDALALAWNEGISRLGISPVYPPQEDLQVGDLLAALVGPKEGNLARQSILLAHIDMRDLILKEQQNRLLFADTVAPKDSNSIRVSDRLSVASPAEDRVALTLAAFPGFAIRYSTRASAAAGAGWWNLIGRRDDEIVQELRIPVAETYRVSPNAALARLQEWCARKESQPNCTLKPVETLLQFAIGNDAFAVKGAKPHVELMFVTQVYLMREIDQRRLNASDRNVGAAASLDAATPVAAPADKAPTTNKGAPSPDVADGAANGPISGARAILNAAASTEISLRESFQRPLAFGFRYLSVQLDDALENPPHSH